MVPFCLSYAWTIWKAQGQTINTKMVLNIGQNEKEHGLTYSAFSRARRSSDIGIDGGFPRNCLIEKVMNQKLMKARLVEERRIFNCLVRNTKKYLE